MYGNRFGSEVYNVGEVEDCKADDLGVLFNSHAFWTPDHAWCFDPDKKFIIPDYDNIDITNRKWYGTHSLKIRDDIEDEDE